MLQRFFSWFTSSPPEEKPRPRALARGVGPEPQFDPADPLADVPRYPPFDTGIPVKTPEEIVASQAELIARIFRTAGVSREEFARLYEPIIFALARHHHLLPATATSHHRGAGGLFRMALEIGLHSLQGANASVFPTGAGVEQRYYLLPKWNLATFIAGVCSQSYRTVSNMVVLDRQNHQWAPLLTPLYDWAKAANADAFFIRWTEARDQVAAQATSAYLINQIVTPEGLQFLSSDNNQVVPMMSSAVTGNPVGAGDNPIARIIAPVLTRIIEDDLKRSTMNYGHLSIGVHLEPHLIDAMRRLIRTGTWACNHRGMRLWVGTDGTFIEWASGAQDVVNLLAKDAFAGVPRDPDTLAGMLCEAGVFEHSPSNGKYWTITLPGSAEVVETAVKLKHNDLIMPSGFDYGSQAKITLTLPPAIQPTASRKEAQPVAPESKVESVSQENSPVPTSGPGGHDMDPETGELFNVSEVGALATEPPRQKPTEKPAEHRQEKREKAQERQSGEKGDGTPKRQETASAPKQKDPYSPAERLLGALKKENAWLMREILQSHANNKLTGKVVAVPQGLGISHEELTAHGHPSTDLMEELQIKGWLWIDKTKPNRKLHTIDVKGRQLRMMVLRPDIAAGLGINGEAI